MSSHTMARTMHSTAAGLVLAIVALNTACRPTDETERRSEVALAGTRTVIPLAGPWELTVEEETRDVEVPSTFEEQVRPTFDGSGIYELAVKPRSIPDRHKLVVHFDGVATKSTVSFNKRHIGGHIGGWTPFRLNATDPAQIRPNDMWRLRVDVDESVGHHTQGFLPIIAPHFGGLWQPVRLLVLPEISIDDLRIMAIGDRNTRSVHFEIPVLHPSNPKPADLAIDILNPTTQAWHTIHESKVQYKPLNDNSNVAPNNKGDLEEKPLTDPQHANGRYAVASSLQVIDVPNSKFEPMVGKVVDWAPSSPTLYTARVRLTSRPLADSTELKFAFRDFTAQGEAFRLNGRPIIVRGVLNWGYAPPRTAPSLDETWMRREIELAKNYGFNLMKFCLWVPPKRYLELCDEMGMLAWIEYPTWHAQLVPENLPELRREYDEFFYYDRNHPSVVLRSLTCETGPSADLQVIQSLYDLAKQRVPGAVVEDDSSWIEWNRIHDFYDDHPYGNNHTWPATLARLRQYISEREAKPLMLGEAIAADTWTSPSHFRELDATPVGQEPFFWPGHLRDNKRWLDALQIRDDHTFQNNSRRYAYLMRKYQIEAYRRLVPEGGYVVSVIRDFPLASMGLIDYQDRPKWPGNAWRFHSETMLLLATENDRRSFLANETIKLPIVVSHFGQENFEQPELRVDLRFANAPTAAIGETHVQLLPAVDMGSVTEPYICKWGPIDVDKPTEVIVSARLSAGQQQSTNEWPIWIFPAPEPMDCNIVKHNSWDAQFLRSELEMLTASSGSAAPSRTIHVARRFDQELVTALDNGAKVLMFPDGGTGSFVVEDHWFLRGGPVVLPENAAATADQPPDYGTWLDGRWFHDLQHLDLAGRVIPRIDPLLSHVSPRCILWDNHDRRETRTHGLLFDMPVGKGLVRVTALNVEGATNGVGRWLLGDMLQSLADRPTDAADPRGTANADRLRSELDRYELALQDRDWAFQPDPEHRGEELGWHQSECDDSRWVTIQANRGWDGQGYPSLDGWAWYRLRIPVPDELRRAAHVYWNFTGVDDYYDAYVNGQHVGSGGDLATKRTAFEEKRSHDITEIIRQLPDNSHNIVLAVAVDDWQGAGGIFRPVTLSTMPIGSDQPWLVK